MFLDIEGEKIMLHISICDDERIAVEKMQRIVENVLEQEQLPAKLETFENGEGVSAAVCHQGRRTGDTGFWYADKKWNRCHTGA